MPHRLYIFFVCASLLIPKIAEAGPFGFEMGEDASKIQGCALAGSGAGVYECSNVRKQHPDIAKYFVRSFPGVGVCWIKGITLDIRSDSFGIELKRVANQFIEQLESVYSKNNKRYDFLMSGSMWKEEKYWMMSLLKGERSYSVFWNEKAKSAMKDGLIEIGASVSASSPDTGWVNLEYKFSNWAKCQEAELKAKSDSL